MEWRSINEASNYFISNINSNWIPEITNIQVNQPFKINGFIKNTSNRTWQLAHGAEMFTYEIFDDEGKLVPNLENFLFKNDIGFVKELKPGEIYRYNGEEHRSKEYYEFTINKAGNYKARTTVNFRAANEKIDHNLKIISNFYEFSVR